MSTATILSDRLKYVPGQTQRPRLLHHNPTGRFRPHRWRAHISPGPNGLPGWQARFASERLSNAHVSDCAPSRGGKLQPSMCRLLSFQRGAICARGLYASCLSYEDTGQGAASSLHGILRQISGRTPACLAVSMWLAVRHTYHYRGIAGRRCRHARDDERSRCVGPGRAVGRGPAARRAPSSWKARAPSGQAAIDRFSDYDILLVVADVRPFAEDDAWQRFLAEPLVRFGDSDAYAGHSRLHAPGGLPRPHQDRLRHLARRAASACGRDSRMSTDLLDWGYRVLLDKDGLAARLPAPTRTAHIPPKPTETGISGAHREFWWESTYAAKYLWRDDLVFASYNLDVVMRNELLLPMLEWRIELDHDWTWKPGVVGPWAEARACRPTSGPPSSAPMRDRHRGELGGALRDHRAVRRVAREVGQALGYAYPGTRSMASAPIWTRPTTCPVRSAILLAYACWCNDRSRSLY